MVMTCQGKPQAVFRPTRRPDITAENVDRLFQAKHFQDIVATRLAESVQIPTVTYDGMGKFDTDPRWGVFSHFSDFLRRTFPIV
jgi:hypothetical protein